MLTRSQPFRNTDGFGDSEVPVSAFRYSPTRIWPHTHHACGMRNAGSAAMRTFVFVGMQSDDQDVAMEGDQMAVNYMKKSGCCAMEARKDCFARDTFA